MPGSVFAFLNGFGQQGWADMSIMNIEVLAGGKRYRFQSEAGTSLKDCLLKAGILEGAECGGRGICGKCAVKVRSGTLAPVEGDESFLMTRGHGKVLACQSLIREDVVIEISAGRDDVRRKV
ncbi:2Fe-2S iron-sulfur cluster-binding protein, partial [Bilophila wadsworthia]